MVIKVPAFNVPPSGYEMGFGFPITEMPVEVGGALDDVVDWAETKDVKAENAKMRVEVKRILMTFASKKFNRGIKAECNEGLGVRVRVRMLKE